jgi:hypothetical protein
MTHIQRTPRPRSRLPRRRGLSAKEGIALEYRGFEFAVVRTIPKGWRWSVKRDHSDIAGTSYDREDAIKKAKQYIDNLLRRHRAQLERQ